MIDMPGVRANQYTMTVRLEKRQGMEKRIFQYRSGYWESIASGVKEAVQRGDQVLSSRTVM